MFEPKKGFVSLHRFYTGEQNDEFRGPFLLSTENPRSLELSSQTASLACKCFLSFGIALAVSMQCPVMCRTVRFGSHLAH